MYKIENQILKLSNNANLHVRLTDKQKKYLELFKKNRSISQIVDELIQQGELVSFSELYNLIEQLHRAKLIQNPIFENYFKKIEDFKKMKVISSKNTNRIVKSKSKPEDYLRTHPFFRTQSPVITSLFSQHAEVIDVKAGTVLCQTGLLERDLYFIVEGEVAIYKNTEQAGRQLIGFFGKDAVIGEIGFFIGELRTADVICTKPSQIVVVRYNEKSFGRIINKNIAKGLQTRFRVVHALTKSPFLSNIPEEALDSLMFAGVIKNYKEHMILTKENDLGDKCFVVVSGSVVISQGSRNINVLGSGQAFGEVALFYTQGRRTATAMTQRETTVIEINAASFYKLLSENLLLACEFEKLAYERVSKMHDLKKTG